MSLNELEKLRVRCISKNEKPDAGKTVQNIIKKKIQPLGWIKFK